MILISLLFTRTSAQDGYLFSYDRNSDPFYPNSIAVLADGSGVVTFGDENGIGFSMNVSAGTFALNTQYTIRVARRVREAFLFVNNNLVGYTKDTGAYFRFLGYPVADRPNVLIATRYINGTSTSTYDPLWPGTIDFVTLAYASAPYLPVTSTCVCAANYYGTNCELTTCSGVASNTSSTCSGHGTCTGYNTCNCAPNYSGNNCQFHSCYGVGNTAANVCRGHGSCTSYNNCVCQVGFTDYNCQYSICNGIKSVDGAVCSGHGTCYGGSCSCFNGYTANLCDVAICNGRTQNDTSVCSA